MAPSDPRIGPFELGIIALACVAVVLLIARREVLELRDEASIARRRVERLTQQLNGALEKIHELNPDAAAGE